MLLQAENISKTFFRDSGSSNYFYAVSPLNLDITSGTLTVLMGRSGSGKTTLLNMLCGILQPTEGRVLMDETDLYSLNDAALSRLRNERTGVIPQGRSAVDTLTVLENILLPSKLYGKTVPAEKAVHWMRELEIDHLADAFPKELSGGELRRMAIIRAIVQDPDVLFADEPTGDLDDENTDRILSAFSSLARRENKAVFIVTHENDAVKYADRLFRMEKGRLEPLSPA